MKRTNPKPFNPLPHHGKMAKIGYDGEPPIFPEARDHAGKGKRSASSLQNINVDRIEWLLAHKRIETHQHGAGRRLQGDSEIAQIGGYASLSGGVGGSGTTRLSDAKCDAISRVNEARAYVGNSGWRIIELVVLENVSLGKAEARMRIRRDSGITALQVALDALARHYGLA